MAYILKPPASLDGLGARSVFLAGSIEMGTATDWQAEVSQALESEDITILNPRRDHWDASLPQTIENETFRQQVEWELEAQERAAMIAMYFAPDTKAPITLLELGLFARSGKLCVCCPDGYWRKGNVEVVCKQYGIPMAETLEALIGEIRAKLGK